VEPGRSAICAGGYRCRDIIDSVIAFRLLVIFTFCWQSFASNTPLDALRLSLIAMRGKPPDYGGPRGATPQLTVAKHQLRDWVESRLPALPQGGDEGAFERRLNSELREAGLFCGERAGDQQPCPEWTLLVILTVLSFADLADF